MQALPADREVFFRRTVYGLLIITTAGAMTGRILTVRSDRGKTPMLSANDRSRWATVRALVEEGTYALDRVLFRPSGDRDPDWYSIDLVRHRGPDGRQHYYSSKPPLLPTLLAAKYWLVRTIIGVTMARDPFYAIRLLLVTTNVLPLILHFWLLALLVERLGGTTWGRLFVMGAATWGTFLTTFAVTLNNHLPAAISVTVAVYAAVRIFQQPRPARSWCWHTLAGLAAAFAAANELPALSLVGLLGAVLLVRSPLPALLGFVPAAACVAGAFLATTFAAHQSWRPPYAHRSDGPVVAALPASVRELLPPDGNREALLGALRGAGLPLSSDALVRPRPQPGQWEIWDPGSEQRWSLAARGEGYVIRSWDDWYEFEGSYWVAGGPRGIDRGEPSRLVYAFHTLLGHHGVFSLTPLWFLSLLGAGIWLTRGPRPLGGLALAVLVISGVCLAFYLARPLADRNYGGMCCGFRWLFWCIPMWLICLVPAADLLGRSWPGRLVAWLLLLVSVVSASYASLNPWSHPWLFNYWTYVEWISYSG